MSDTSEDTPRRSVVEAMRDLLTEFGDEPGPMVYKAWDAMPVIIDVVDHLRADLRQRSEEWSEARHTLRVQKREIARLEAELASCRRELERQEPLL